MKREDKLRREEVEFELRRAEIALKEEEILHNDSINGAQISEMQRNEEKERSVVYKAKVFGDALKGTMSKMPQGAVELVPYFRSAEQLFVDFGVEKKITRSFTQTTFN